MPPLDGPGVEHLGEPLHIEGEGVVDVQLDDGQIREVGGEEHRSGCARGRPRDFLGAQPWSDVVDERPEWVVPQAMQPDDRRLVNECRYRGRVAVEQPGDVGDVPG